MSDSLRALDLIVQEIQRDPAPNLLHDLALNLVSAARRALAQIESPDAAVELRNRVRAVEVYAKRQRALLADSNLISAERLRIERTTGELLARTAQPGNPQFSHDGRNGKLPDGISWNDSSRWQKLAAIDAADFETWLTECLTTEQEISTAAALGLWSRYVQPPPAPADEDAEEALPIHQIYCPHCGNAVLLTAPAQVLEHQA